MTKYNSPPTKTGIVMANAFIQVFKYNEGSRDKIVYDPDNILYYSLFVDDYTNTIKQIDKFIKKNKTVLIDYLQKHYSEEYQQRDIFTKKLKQWNNCSSNEIIYALSSEHPNCLHVLEYFGDKDPTTNNYTSFMWVSYTSVCLSSEPCDPQENSCINDIKMDISRRSSLEYSTPADIWTYTHDMVIGGGDY